MAIARRCSRFKAEPAVGGGGGGRDKRGKGKERKKEKNQRPSCSSPLFFFLFFFSPRCISLSLSFSVEFSRVSTLCVKTYSFSARDFQLSHFRVSRRPNWTSRSYQRFVTDSLPHDRQETNERKFYDRVQIGTIWDSSQFVYVFFFSHFHYLKSCGSLARAIGTKSYNLSLRLDQWFPTFFFSFFFWFLSKIPTAPFLWQTRNSYYSKKWIFVVEEAQKAF